MFRNYLAAALRNSARNRLYAAINIVGLAMGFAAALLIALFVRDELSYDRWIPGHDSIYRLSRSVQYPSLAPFSSDTAGSSFAAPLKLEFPDVESITRLASAPRGSSSNLSLRHGDVDAVEPNFYWADPNVFDVLPLAAVAGDLHTALDQPDSIVITRKIARKYFGVDTPLGETLEIDRQHVMRVTAVLEDIPSNTHLALDVIASGRASFSELARADAVADSRQAAQAYTYLRLREGAPPDALQAALPEFLDSHMAPIDNLGGRRSDFERLNLTPIAGIHLHPAGFGAMKQPGDPAILLAVAAVGLLIVFVAGINFVNLMTARTARRLIEVGVRKVSGARRIHLIVQFMGEAGMFVLFGLALAVVLVHLVLPAYGAFLDRTFTAGWWTSPDVAVGMGVFALVASVCAGLYPALTLSAFRPARVLKSALPHGSAIVRQALSIAQFTILIGLIAGTSIIYRQTSYALTDGLRLEKDQVLLIDRAIGHCNDAYADAVRKLPGVAGAACSDAHLLGLSYIGGVTSAAAQNITVQAGAVEAGLPGVYGLRMISGRFFEDGRAADIVPENKQGTRNIVINETAVRKFGFISADAAVGQAVTITNTWRCVSATPAQIIGVVADFATESIQALIEPSIFFVDPSRFNILSVKLTGHAIPETLAALDQLWQVAGDPNPLQRIFFDRRIQERYLQLVRQGQVFAGFAAVALLIAGMGLFGLSAFTAEQRTKEIGIRKAIGARTADVLRLMLWQFIKPVLWASIIAWPAAYFIMRRWLEAFAYHIDLEPWTFLAASALAVVIAVTTVASHAILVARAQPVAALRYE